MGTKPISELMTPQPATVKMDAGLAECAAFMEQRRISSLIVEDDGLPVGILTERDILRAFSTALPLETPAAEVMGKPLVTVEPETDYRTAYHLLVRHNIRHLVVVDPEGKTAGIVSETDFRRKGGVEEYVGLRDVASIMSAHYQKLPPSGTVAEAAELMAKTRETAILIVENDTVSGIVTERDMVKLYRRGKGQTALRDVMSAPVATVSPHQPVVEAVQHMQNGAFRHLAVVNNAGQLVGMLSEHDVVKQTEGHYVELLQAVVHAQAEALHHKQAQIDEMEIKMTLAESENRYRALVENLPQRIWVKDRSLNYLSCNPAAAHLLGLHTPDEIVGRNDYQYYPVEAAAHLRKEDRRVIDSGLTLTREEQCPLTDRWFLVTRTPLRDATNKISGVIGIAEDFTARKQMERDLRESEARFRTMTESLPMLVWSAGTSGDCNWFSPAWLAFTGRTMEQETGQGWLESVHPEDQARILGQYEASFARREQFTLEYRLRHRSGEYRWLIDSGHPIFGEGNVFVGYLGYSIDITEQHQREDELRLARTVFDNIDQGVLLTDRNSIVVAVNPAFCSITGYQPDEILGRTPRLLSSGYHDPSFYRALWDDLLATGSWRGKIRNRRKSGEVYPEFLSIRAVLDSKGEVHRYVGIFSDISEIEVQEERMRHLAHYDALTDLPNRTLLNDRITQVHVQSRRAKERYALLFIDLDEFKPINDRLGHNTGDALLQEVAKRLTATIREADTAARVGGDEFVVLLPGIGAIEDARAVAEKLVAALGEPLEIGGLKLHISVSIGVAVYPEHGEDERILMNYADQAMYLAKQGGKNRIAVFNSPPLPYSAI
jgi:diguanylate cyclase (GGDEF)-like protein/PAS domain S-box-containing protein